MRVRFRYLDGEGECVALQMNTAKWPFSIDDDGENIVVDIALPKFLDSAQVRCLRRLRLLHMLRGVMPRRFSLL